MERPRTLWPRKMKGIIVGIIRRWDRCSSRPYPTWQSNFSTCHTGFLGEAKMRVESLSHWFIVSMREEL